MTYVYILINMSLSIEGRGRMVCINVPIMKFILDGQVHFVVWADIHQSKDYRILLLSWFDSNVCTILRHLSLIAWFICELIHFIMSWTFLKGLLSCYTNLTQRWVFGILVWTDTCFWNEEPNSSSKSGQSFALVMDIIKTNTKENAQLFGECIQESLIL